MEKEFFHVHSFKWFWNKDHRRTVRSVPRLLVEVVFPRFLGVELFIVMFSPFFEAHNGIVNYISEVNANIK